MATKTIEELLVLIDASTQGLREELRKAETAVKDTTADIDRATKKAGGSFDFMSKAAIRASGAIAAAFGVGALVRGIESTAERIEEVERQAAALGASADAIQELHFTFRQFHLEANDVADALGTLADRAKDAESGTASFIEDFALLGVEVDDLRAKRPEELLRLVAERVSQIEDPTRRTAGIVRIFGDDLGRRLAPLLIQGAEGFDRFARQAHDAGAVLDEDLRQSTVEAAREIRRLREVLGAEFAAEVAENAESIQALAEALTGLVGVLGMAIEGYRDLGRVAAQFMLPEGIDEQLDETNRQLNQLIENRERLESRPGTGPEAFAAIDAQIESLRQRRQQLMTAQDLIRRGEGDDGAPPSNAPPSNAGGGGAEGAGEEDGNAYAEGFQRAARRRLRVADTLLPPGMAGPTLPVEPGLDEIANMGAVERQMLGLFKPAAREAESIFEPVVDEADEAADQIESRFASLGEGMGDSLLDSAVGAMMGIEQEWDDTIKRMLANAALQQLFSIFASFGGPVGKAFSFLGFDSRAAGGPLRPGIPTIVGERGPELIVSRDPGFVVPNHRLGAAGGGLSIHIGTINADDAIGVRRAVAEGVLAAVQISDARSSAKIASLRRPSIS